MIYSGDSPIHGTGTATTALIDAWFAQRGPQYASYAPDGLYAPAPVIGGSIVAYASRWGMNSDLVAAQMMNESAAWQSAIARLKNNPSGYGAENDDPFGKATTFPSPDAGIRATVAHLASYCNGHGDWDEYDPRQVNIIAEGWLGVVRILNDLNGRWASPGTTYGAGIAALANELVTFAHGQTGGAVIDISGFVPPRVVQQWFPVNGVSYLGETMDMRGVCIHETGNTSAGAEAQQNVTYMNSQECISRQASWQSTVGLDIIIETIPDTKQAFHGSDGSGPGNTHFFAIEGVVCYPVGSPEFQRVLMNHAWYAAKKLRDKGLPLRFNDQNTTYQVGASIAQHHNFARDSKDCPSQYRDTPGKWQQFVDYATAFYDRNEWSVPVDDVRWFAETGHSLGGAFRTYWESNGGLAIFGYPLTDEIQEDGRVVQYFERAVFQFWPENQDPYRVLLRRLGAEELERKEAA